MPTATSQQPVHTARAKDTDIANLKSAILANMDTINTLVEERKIIIKELKTQNHSLKRKVTVLERAPVMHDTLVVYIDTCLSVVDYNTIEIDSSGKAGWFKKLFNKKHKQH